MMIRCVMGAENLPAFVQGMVNVVVGMTVWETREHSPQTSQLVSYRGVAYEVGGLTVTVDISPPPQAVIHEVLAQLVGLGVAAGR